MAAGEKPNGLGDGPPVDEAKRSWAARVRFAGGDESFAYVPNQFLVGPGEQDAVIRAMAPGARKVVIGRTCEGVEIPDVAGEYTRWEYEGDVLSVVRRLRAAGVKVQPLHVFFLDAGPNDVSANPVYGNPVYGNPVYGNPVYGNPVYGNPVYGNPVYGNPVYGNPVYGNPVYGNPVYGNPVYGNPGYGGPTVLFPSPCGCEDADKCQCPTTPPASPASGVYPNPIYVAKAYPAGEGVTYRLTGQRRSQAMPLLGVSKNNVGKVQPWDTAAVRVAVLDNGFSSNAAVAPVADSQSDVAGDDDAEADGDKDRYLDPVAGHGTFIGGLIARIAPGCGLQIYSPLTAYGDGDEFAIAKLIEKIIEQDKPPHFLNLSFSGYTLEDEAAECLHNAVQKAMKKGIVIVASAGNDGVSRKAFPAAFPGVVSVAALGHDGPAPFSNWGSWVRACAPGVDIVSTFFHYSQGREREKYGVDPDEFKGWAIWSGTSFAAPVVTAALARAMQAAKLQEAHATLLAEAQAAVLAKAESGPVWAQRSDLLVAAASAMRAQAAAANPPTGPTDQMQHDLANQTKAALTPLLEQARIAVQDETEPALFQELHDRLLHEAQTALEHEQVEAMQAELLQKQHDPAPVRPTFSPYDAVEAIIDQDGLYRLRCYGTVVNQLAVRPLCK